MDGTDEPIYVAEPIHQAEPPHVPPEPAGPSPWRRRLIGGAVVVVLAVVAVVVLLTRSDGTPIGERTAQLAAQRFVAALNAGNRDAAAADSCANFANEARSVAESGADPDIDFVLGSVRVTGIAGTAQITQRLRFSGSTQQVAHVVHLDEQGGRWIVCGQQ